MKPNWCLKIDYSHDAAHACSPQRKTKQGLTMGWAWNMYYSYITLVILTFLFIDIVLMEWFAYDFDNKISM